MGDVILKANGKSASSLNAEQVVALMRSSGIVLLLDVVTSGGDIPQDEKVTYSKHSACPYYLSQALAVKA